MASSSSARMVGATPFTEFSGSNGDGTYWYDPGGRMPQNHSYGRSLTEMPTRNGFLPTIGGGGNVVKTPMPNYASPDNAGLQAAPSAQLASPANSGLQPSPATSGGNTTKPDPGPSPTSATPAGYKPTLGITQPLNGGSGRGGSLTNQSQTIAPTTGGYNLADAMSQSDSAMRQWNAANPYATQEQRVAAMKPMGDMARAYQDYLRGNPYATNEMKDAAYRRIYGIAESPLNTVSQTSQTLGGTTLGNKNAALDIKREQGYIAANKQAKRNYIYAKLRKSYPDKGGWGGSDAFMEAFRREIASNPELWSE